MSGSCSVIAGWTWGRSLYVPIQPQPLHNLILCPIAPFSWRIWFACLLLPVLPRSHPLRADFFHLTHLLPGAYRIRRKACKCPHDRGVGSSGDVPPIYCVRDTSVCCVRCAYLENRSCNQHCSGLPRFSWRRIVSFRPSFFHCCRFLLAGSVFNILFLPPFVWELPSFVFQKSPLCEQYSCFITILQPKFRWITMYTIVIVPESSRGIVISLFRPVKIIKTFRHCWDNFVVNVLGMTKSNRAHVTIRVASWWFIYVDVPVTQPHIFILPQNDASEDYASPDWRSNKKSIHWSCCCRAIGASSWEAIRHSQIHGPRVPLGSTFFFITDLFDNKEYDHLKRSSRVFPFLHWAASWASPKNLSHISIVTSRLSPAGNPKLPFHVSTSLLFRPILPIVTTQTRAWTGTYIRQLSLHGNDVPPWTMP